MKSEARALFVANEAREVGSRMAVEEKYGGAKLGDVCSADAGVVEEAISVGVTGAAAMAKLPAFRRSAALRHVRKRLLERSDEFARMLVREVGKPIRDARAEVARACDTFGIAAEEATRIYGEMLPLDVVERGEGYRGMTKRVPVGLCSFITPFNFPLNLAAHKIAPAIAAGCSFVLKPAPATPITSLMLGEVLAETDLPRGAFSILPMENDLAGLLVRDERPKLLSFTGSANVGWALKAEAGNKKVTLELGGNAACIVDAGLSDAQIERAVERIAFGSFYQSGQSCISVQRVLVHGSAYDAVKNRLITAAGEQRMGDPMDEQTTLGPLVSDKEADKVEAWINEARQAGARVLTGGERTGRFISAAVVENVPSDVRLWREEVFGPVVVLRRFEDFDEAINLVNDSAYGLQAGVFTNDLGRAMRAWDELEVGGVIVNDVPSMRIDAMPYGGVKDSGLGREGVRWAIEDMTETRLLVVRV